MLSQTEANVVYISINVSHARYCMVFVALFQAIIPYRNRVHLLSIARTYNLFETKKLTSIIRACISATISFWSGGSWVFTESDREIVQ